MSPCWPSTSCTGICFTNKNLSRTRARFSRSLEQWLRLLRLLRYANQIYRQILISHRETLGQRKWSDRFNFQKWSWLDYGEASDSVICLYCSHAFDNKLLTDALYKKRENAYLTTGFTNWKDATTSFKAHEQSQYHVDAVKVMATPRMDVAEMLSRGHNQEKKVNGPVLFIAIRCIIP